MDKSCISNICHTAYVSLLHGRTQHDEVTQMGIDNINALLDSFMGINDSELAEQVCTRIKKFHCFRFDGECAALLMVCVNFSFSAFLV